MASTCRGFWAERQSASKDFPEALLARWLMNDALHSSKPQGNGALSKALADIRACIGADAVRARADLTAIDSGWDRANLNAGAMVCPRDTAGVAATMCCTAGAPDWSAAARWALSSAPLIRSRVLIRAKSSMGREALRADSAPKHAAKIALGLSAYRAEVSRALPWLLASARFAGAKNASTGVD